MTRILHILDHSLPLHSGYTFRTRAIMKAQQASGLDVRGITGLRHSAGGEATETVEGLTFHRTPGSANGPVGLREWREIGLLADAIDSLCDSWRPDILHAHSPALDGMAALRIARKRQIPLVYEIRAFWEDAAVGNGTGRFGSLKYRLTRALENRVVAGADAVMTICHGLRDDLVARGFPGGKIGIMPNGVDLGLFGNPPPRDAALAQELGLGDGPVIGFIGSFYDYEGIDDLIDAMPLVLAQHPDARLLLVGGGPMTDALQRRAEASPARAAIRFVGRVPHAEVERYYALTDIMAYPRKASRLTDLVTPLKPLEAMAQGKLVAASDVGGHRELMTDGVTGTLFAADNPEACAAALSVLLFNRNQWAEQRQRAQDHVRKSHDWAQNVTRYQDVYQALLANSAQSGFPATVGLGDSAKTGVEQEQQGLRGSSC
ncbi:putative glycosyltransferase [Caenibius tardaugens NBRC 16725]|uniref:Putative glycosyltransferase n=1 Tax=Caenibius tardaugens NBRC 16725 TaxID=1219035 RepID=U2YKC2_9SPHN|nr:TIGR04063 family PEP-CTERM/XrtA system glycosyltransferase [Caenibius tardaugens]AZI36177.1 glycosyltransferase, exosortase A system-associated [Caenibius tardaugens NBRC 16725]GAD48732.1 putative glycosyltransferase [Caenibius tardaugens NBRC 16725]